MSAAVTVAIVSWNTRDLLRECLTSLRHASEEGIAEVWVLDNASTDGSPAMVGREFPWVSLVESPENLGFGRGVNEIARRTKSAWLAPANADLRVSPAAIRALLEAGRSHPRAGLLAPQLVMPNGETQHSVHAFPTPSLAFLFGFGVYRVVPGLGRRLCIEGHWDHEEPRFVPWAHGAFLLVRREAFDEIGGFDPEQWMYAEDLDLAWRAKHAGWRTWYEPAAEIHHEVSAAAVKAFGSERMERYMAATYAWMARRRGIAVTWIFALTSIVASTVRWARLRVLSVAGVPDAAKRATGIRAYMRVHAHGLRSRRALVDAARQSTTVSRA